MLISATCAAFAVATIITAGLAALRCIVPPSAAGSLVERIGLAWLLGCGWVSVMIAVLGSLLDGAGLVAGVVISTGVLVFLGRLRTTPATPASPRLSAWETLLLAVIAAQIVLIGIFASRMPLGWDALMTWEWKSRLAFLNGGSLPAKYFTDTTYVWSLPRYPLQLSYVGSWLYLCLGRFDQAWFRLIGPLYYLAGVCIVAGACHRIQGSRALGLCAGVMMFFVPIFFAGTWGMFCGYADIPLGVLLVASISRIPALHQDSGPEQARLLGILAALLPWMKREGMHLWIVVMLLAVIQLWRLRSWRDVAWAITPGIVLIAGFASAMEILDAIPLHQAVTVSLAELGGRMDRVPLVMGRLGSKVFDFEVWSFLWPGAIVAVVALAFRRKYQLALIFGGALILCWSLLGAAYIVGFPNNLEAMIGVTIDRILLQFAPLAVLTMAIAVPGLPPKFQK